MKKYIASLLVLVLSFSASVMALDIESSVKIAGASAPSGKFYIPVANGYDAVFGFSSVIPGSEGEELDVDLLIGTRTSLPILHEVDVYLSFDHDNTNAASGDFQLNTLNVSKAWNYRLTDRIDLGLEMVLGSLYLEGSNRVAILSEIYPIVSATIDF